MKKPIPSEALAQLFAEARSYNGYTDQAIDDETIARLYELLKWGPTSMNCQPARYLFIRSDEKKSQLIPAMSATNKEKTASAPLTVVVASDRMFYEQLPTQFRAYDAAPMFRDNPALADSTEMRNSSLQGAYLIMAARALGLDCGPMSGFDAEQVNQTFFPDGRWRVNFIVNLGYGADESLYPRGDRLDFEQVARVL